MHDDQRNTDFKWESKTLTEHDATPNKNYEYLKVEFWYCKIFRDKRNLWTKLEWNCRVEREFRRRTGKSLIECLIQRKNYRFEIDRFRWNAKNLIEVTDWLCPHRFDELSDLIVDFVCFLLRPENFLEKPKDLVHFRRKKFRLFLPWREASIRDYRAENLEFVLFAATIRVGSKNARRFHSARKFRRRKKIERATFSLVDFFSRNENGTETRFRFDR